MANSTETLASLDAKIHSALSRAGMTDVMTVAGTDYEGYFNIRFIEDGAGEDALIGEYPTFDTLSSLPEIDPEDEVTIGGQGTFRYLRRQSAGIGRVLVILGNVLA